MKTENNEKKSTKLLPGSRSEPRFVRGPYMILIPMFELMGAINAQYSA